MVSKSAEFSECFFKAAKPPSWDHIPLWKFWEGLGGGGGRKGGVEYKGRVCFSWFSVRRVRWVIEKDFGEVMSMVVCC